MSELSDEELLAIVSSLRDRRASLAAKYGVTAADKIVPGISLETPRRVRWARQLGTLQELLIELADTHRRVCRVRDVCRTCRFLREGLAVIVAGDEIDMAEEAVYQQNASQGGSPNA